MAVTTLKIIELTPNASTYEDGEVIYGLIRQGIAAGEEVLVDFSGVRAVPSAFVNGAFVRLLEDYPFDKVRTSLKFQKSTRQINELIRHRFSFVASRIASAVPS